MIIIIINGNIIIIMIIIMIVKIILKTIIMVSPKPWVLYVFLKGKNVNLPTKGWVEQRIATKVFNYWKGLPYYNSEVSFQ